MTEEILDESLVSRIVQGKNKTLLLFNGYFPGDWNDLEVKGMFALLNFYCSSFQLENCNFKA